MPDYTPRLPEDPASLGPYTLIGRLGRGGYGVVYLGETPSSERVAIKLLQTQLAEAGGERDRFAREAAAAKQVARFCTAQVLDADIAGDQPYIVSEYVPGPSLQALVNEQGPLQGGALDRLAIGIATALVAIHQAAVVHRDLKPPNVLIGPDGPRVIDFGIARMMDNAATMTGHVLGTPAYMAPEQVTAREITPATDVFAWGATMVFAANGTPPFGRDTLAALAHRILNEQPDLGVLSGRLRTLVAECLDKDPARRPTASMLLMRLLGHDAVPGAAPGQERDQRTSILAEGVTAAVANTLPPVGNSIGTAETMAAGPGPARGAGEAPAQARTARMPAAGDATRPAGPMDTTAAAPRRRSRSPWLALAGIAGAAVLAGGVIFGLDAFHGHGGGGGAASSSPSVEASQSRQSAAQAGDDTPDSPESSPEQGHTDPPSEPTFSIDTTTCDLGDAQTDCTITLSVTGAGVDWTASTSPPLSLSSSSGHLDPGSTYPVTISLHADSPRTEGSGSVTFSGAGATHTVSVTWAAEPAPDPSAS